MAVKKSVGGLQLPLFAPESDWKPTPVSELPSWKGIKRIGLDTETKDEFLKQLGIGVRRGGYIIGVSFAIEDGPGYYLPIRHQGGGNLDEQQVLRYLRDQAATYDGEIVGANLQYDLDYLLEEGVEFKKVKYFRDIQVADPLIYELHDKFSLQAIAERCGLPGKDMFKLEEAARAFGVDPKSGMWRLHSKYVGAYAEQDAHEPLRILRRQERKIDEDDLWEVYNLESKVLPVLVRMRRRGVRVDEGRLARVEEWSLAQEREALELVKRETGYQVGVGNIWKASALAPALEAIGVNLKVTSQGQPQIDKFLLDGTKHPVAKALLWARKVNKLRTTFAGSVREHMVNGRIHCTFNQIAREDENGDQRGARYGRLSCVMPNLQQQPSRDEFAKMWREIYLPEEGGLWASNDYSQQEPRWTTHFAAVMNLSGARAAAKAYWDNPKLDNHDFMTGLVYQIRKEDDPELFDKKRKFAKNIYLGLCYGEGGAKLARDCKLPTRWALASGRGRERRVEYFTTREEAFEGRREREDGYVFETAGEDAQAIIDQFDARAPFIRELSNKAKDRAMANGYVKTISGRRLHFPVRDDGSYDWAHKALNRVIQGSSADQTKEAIVAIDEAGYFLQLQVHDETDSSVGDEKEAHEIAAIMRDIRAAEVPFRVDTEIGPSWGEAK